MELLVASNAPEKKLNNFLDNNENVDKNLLLKKGYVVEMKGTIEGCFVMDLVDNQEDKYWLKQLHITPGAAASLPILLESILAMAKEKQAKQVFVHSHQPMVDVLLDALQFYPQTDNMMEKKHPNNKGSWWTYNVS